MTALLQKQVDMNVIQNRDYRRLAGEFKFIMCLTIEVRGLWKLREIKAEIDFYGKKNFS
jgi:hypothetical protein